MRRRSLKDFKNKYEIRIKENSWIASIAAFKLRAAQVAIVIGKTVHLHNTSRSDFLYNTRWLKHELCHIDQFAKHGFLKFLYLYLIESIRKGYYNNKYEVQARNAETEICDFSFVNPLHFTKSETSIHHVLR